LVSHVEDVDGNGYKDLITINSSFRSDNNLNILYQDSLGNFLETSQSGIESNNIPLKIELFQNYPNPFNPVTQIRFALAKTADVKVSVYNVNGQKITELVNGLRHAGVHLVDFDGSRLNSGIYYYTLETDGKALTRKMLLIK
jgi:hypothetical protein